MSGGTLTTIASEGFANCILTFYLVTIFSCKSNSPLILWYHFSSLDSSLQLYCRNSGFISIWLFTTWYYLIYIPISLVSFCEGHCLYTIFCHWQCCGEVSLAVLWWGKMELLIFAFWQQSLFSSNNNFNVRSWVPDGFTRWFVINLCINHCLVWILQCQRLLEPANPAWILKQHGV